MRALIFCLSFFLTASLAFSQNDATAEQTGLPGDQFSLEGALETFKKATSPEEFEKLLNELRKKIKKSLFVS